jgi:hypothetical protein
MGFREATDDARRLVFWLGLAGSVVTAIATGVFVTWWSGVWSMAPPVRFVLVLVACTAAFLLWYSLLFASHYYFGRPKANPFWSPAHASSVVASDAVQLVGERKTSTSPSSTGQIVVSGDLAAALAEKVKGAEIYLPDDVVSVAWNAGAHGLHFSMKNETGDVIDGCAMHVDDIERWSEAKGRFIVVPEYHTGPNQSFEAFRLVGTGQIFPERSVGFTFIVYRGSGQYIEGGGRLSHRDGTVKLEVSEPGLWRVKTTVRARTSSRTQEMFFKLDSGQRPEPATDPRGAG